MKILLFKEKKARKVCLDFINVLNEECKSFPDVNAVISSSTSYRAPLNSEPISLIHVIGKLNKSSLYLVFKAHRKKIPVIYSPMGELLILYTKRNRLVRVIQKSLFKYIVSKGIALIHVCGMMEYEQIVAHLHTSNITLIGNPNLSARISPQAATTQMISEYAKANTSYNQHIHESIVHQLKKQQVDQNLSDICEKLIFVRYEKHRDGLTTAILQDIAEALHQCDCDEDQLAEVLKSLKIDDFTSSLEQVLYEKELLTEGFMPIPAKKDRLSRAILQQTHDF